MTPFLDKVRQVQPYLQTLDPAPEKERLQSPEESLTQAEVIRCILCACCTASCPVVNQDQAFLGPAPLVWAFRYIFDSRDQETLNRLKAIDNPDGAWGCQNHFECTRVCPKEIRVTKSINLLKKEIERHLDRKVD
jgi:succinate dehydrogenase / fumarate reductase iron-sulfur subunit